MAASKKSNTSKTAHVMNLLSKSSPPPAAPAEEVPVPAQEEQPPLPILDDPSPDTAVASQVKEALEDALLAELGLEAPAAEPVPAQEESPAPEPEPVQAEPPAPEPEPVQAEPPAPEPEPVQAEPPAPEPTQEEFSYVNVMQVLVEEKVDKYIKLFGLCDCPRCRMDVQALALNNLQPKYVVMSRGEAIPRITLYEGRYAAAITAQILRACQAVMDAPHHTRSS